MLTSLKSDLMLLNQIFTKLLFHFMCRINFLLFLFRWNQLDVFIVGLSVAGIVLEKMENDLIPINPTIIRVFRVMRIARGDYNYYKYFLSSFNLSK